MAVRSLLTGATGLRGHQTMLDVVANNLANVNTTAYKSQRLRFADQMWDTIRSASGPSGTLGGTNPQQIGLGVRVAAIDKDFQQGVLELTGNELDLAIQDNGFFVLDDGTQNLFTRAGAFEVDEEGFLVDTGTGFHVQRVGTLGEGVSGEPAIQATGNTNVRIPYGALIPGEQTTRIELVGNLDALAIGPLQEVLTTNTAYTVGGAPAVGATPLNSLDLNQTPYVAGDVIDIIGTGVDGSAVSASYTIGSGTDDLNALLGAINTAYNSGSPAGATAMLDAAGNIVLTANSTGPALLTLALADQTTPPNTGATFFSALSLTTDGKDGDTTSTAIEIFDSQGSPHVLTLTWQKTTANEWSLTASTPDAPLTDPVVNRILFNSDGSLANVIEPASEPGIEIDWAGGGSSGVAGQHRIQFDFGTTDGFDGLTQFGGFASATATDQDGFAAGNLLSLDVERSGTITGLFSNGQRAPIAQLAMAVFANQAGLNEEGNGYFAVSPNSGIPLIGTPGTSGRGTVVNGVLESSNVDVGLEFVRLITAQRGFQVNARTIRVSDEVLEEAVNLIR